MRASREPLMSDATFLHVTDVHFAAIGSPLPRDAVDGGIPAIERETREDAVHHLFERIADRLRDEDTQLDGVIFSGDAQTSGRPGGHGQLFDLLMESFSRVGLTPERIVATPGNHDVPRGSPPSSAERYEAFISVWRANGCITPWLDGVDDPVNISAEKHTLRAADNSWVVFALNSSNWCQIFDDLQPDLASIWSDIPARLAGTDGDLERTLRKELERLRLSDVPRLSPRQLEVFRRLVEGVPSPTRGSAFRIATMHHQLRSPTLSEDLRAHEGISNLEQVREALRQRDVGLVVHGHKHEHALYQERIYAADTDAPHFLTVLSGSSFNEWRQGDAVRLVSITGLPHVPRLAVQPVPLPRQGLDLGYPASYHERMWQGRTLPSGPTVIQGTDLDEVYARVIELAGAEASKEMLIVHLDLPPEMDLPIPTDYPPTTGVTAEDRDDWFAEVVRWWQLPDAKPTKRFPHPHGSRLRNYAGKLDQVERILNLLQGEATTRALAVLVDPMRDFTADGRGEEFVSFCLVEFRMRGEGATSSVDVTAFYRVQEFSQWWPVNVAELRQLQKELCERLGRGRPGRITTVAASARYNPDAPAQVAISAVERWRDQNPERLHALSVLLSGGAVLGEIRPALVKGWTQTLSELRRVAERRSEDNAPIPVHGLRVLADYVEVTSNNASGLVSDLRGLADLNGQYLANTKTLEAFQAWSRQVLTLLERLPSADSWVSNQV